MSIIMTWGDKLIVLRPDIAARLIGDYDIMIDNQDNSIRGNDVIKVSFTEEADAIMFRICYLVDGPYEVA
jgi:hypothetical protein